MARVNFDTCYVSCGCNRTPHCADWGQNNLICFGSSFSVAIYQPKNPACITHTLAKHTSRVNSVQWIRKTDCGSEDEILSCSTDKTAIVWKKCDSEYNPIAVLKGHEGAVTIGSAIYVPKLKDQDERTLVATAAVDSTVRIWSRSSNSAEFTHTQTLQFGTGFVMAVAWTIIPVSNVPLLACAGDDQKIHIYVEENGQFVRVQTLVGHEDWVRGLDFTTYDNGDVLLASCAQDCLLRIWRVSPRSADQINQDVDIKQLQDNEDIQVKEDIFSVQSKEGEKLHYAVSLESILAGHEHWVYSIHWHPPVVTDGKRHQPMCLLSASMDKTMILWKPDEETGVWIEQVRVGEVGGNTLGFFGGVFSPGGEIMLAHGYQGAFHMWNKKQDDTMWEPSVTCGGHFDSVQDLAWQPGTGDFLLSVSTDQTTRLHAYWRNSDKSQCAWHELARPQVHGYDMQCLAMLNNYTLVSAADEKVIRMFDAPRNFIENFGKVSQIDVTEILKNKPTDTAQGASVPALGLSNKAVYEEGKQAGDTSTDERIIPQSDNSQYPLIYFCPLTLNAPPTEENLLQNTLWPEVQKLYGHGYEIFSLACHPNGSLVASCCKAAKAEHAAIILWDVKTWQPVCQLGYHSLTVTQLAFSHSGSHLLAVSRDRTWSLWKQQQTSDKTDKPYVQIACTDKKTSVHSRIIWSCAWTHDDKYFVTVSRDKKAVVWGEGETDSGGNLGRYCPMTTPLDLTDAITAVDCAPIILKRDRYLMAFGLECGNIELYTWYQQPANNESSWTPLHSLNNSVAHHLVVKRLKFRPHRVEDQPEDKDTVNLNLASCGGDHAVKIYKLSVTFTS